MCIPHASGHRTAQRYRNCATARLLPAKPAPLPNVHLLLTWTCDPLLKVKGLLLHWHVRPVVIRFTDIVFERYYAQVPRHMQAAYAWMDQRHDMIDAVLDAR